MLATNMQQKNRIKLGDNSVDVRESNHVADKTIVMVHGIGVSGAYFMPLAKELAQEYRVLVVDMPGYGTTPQPAAPLGIKQLAEVLEGVVKHYKLSDPMLVGQSMGCQIVAELAAQKNNVYSKIVLIGPTINRKERNRFLQGFRLLQDTFFEPFRLNKLVLRDYKRMGAARYMQTSTFMITNRIEQNLKIYSGRTLIIRGVEDRICPRDWCRYLSGVCRFGRFVEVNDAAHLAQYTQPKKVAEACKRFFVE